MIQGVKIPISNSATLPSSVIPKNQVQGNLWNKVDQEIRKLSVMKVIVKSEHEEGEIISPIFLVQKPDGSYRMILNLKEFNESVEYEHFKMENLSSATSMMKEGCYMASVDLRHAYYSVPVHSDFKKFLKFQWRGQLYVYTCFPNGLANCPRYFTKLLKPVYAFLRAQGFLSASFIDDCYLQGQSIEECKKNILSTVNLFQKLGFTIHDGKSVLVPTQKLKYLGFILDSKKMTVTLSEDKINKIKSACLGLMQKKVFSVRELAQVIGKLVAAFPGVKWGPLHYRQLERLKTKALKVNAGNFDAIMSMTKKAKRDLEWWIANVTTSYYPLKVKPPSLEMKTDASTSGGWGAVCDTKSTGGRWNEQEKDMHINALELLAIKYGLRCFEKDVTGRHIKLMCDNVCAVTYVKNMGGSRSRECNEIAKQIWIWCRNRDIELTITYIPGKLNIEADRKSRQFNDRTEWMLNPKIFEKLFLKFSQPHIDLFASRLNCQIKPFISWGPDPDSIAVDAFTVNWSVWDNVYAFPPFSLIQKTLCKLEADQAEGMFIIPHWPTAVWFPQMLNLLIQQPVRLPQGKTTLQLPHSEAAHPLHHKLQLLAVQLSGKPSKHKDFMAEHVTLCVHRGESQRKDNMHHILRAGNCFVLQETVIPFIQL